MHNPATHYFTNQPNQPVDKVAQIVEEFAVILGQEVVPREGGVLALRSDVEQVEPPDVGRDARVLGVVTKHSHTAALGELAILVVQVFCSGRKVVTVLNILILPDTSDVVYLNLCLVLG